MTQNTKRTSKQVASLAGKTLSSGSASSTQKSLSGSALRQARGDAQTGAQTEAVASKSLNSPRSSPTTKKLAGSVVSQSNRKR